MGREKTWVEDRRTLGPIIMSSVLLLLRLTKLLSIQILMLAKQFVMVRRMTGMTDLVQMCSSVSPVKQ